MQKWIDLKNKEGKLFSTSSGSQANEGASRVTDSESVADRRTKIKLLVPCGRQGSLYFSFTTHSGGGELGVVLL